MGFLTTFFNFITPSPTRPYSRTSPVQVGRSKSDVSLMRDKNGCITCRVRQKKCSGLELGQAACGDCLRLNMQCLGVQHNLPDWLRNPKALKETKHRIKHFLTEYPVPRGRGPAPERPHLNFHDLMEKYSPRVPSLEEEFKNMTLKPESPDRMEPDPPTHSACPSVQSAHLIPSTLPSSSYAVMPQKPTSAEGSLFTHGTPSPTTSYSRTSPVQVGRSKSDVSLIRDKNGCITCRVRQKKCSGVEPGQAACGDCLRLNVQCLGVQHNRPDWLRNPEALKETKHRIKHFLTEYPVPRGRGPAPERPHLNFHDLIEKYSPRVPSLDECKHLTIKSERLYRMEPGSSSHGAYLSVQSAHHSPSTPSPSASYAVMPRTPTSAEDSLFTPGIPACNYPEGMFAQDVFMPQPVGAAYPEAYMQYDAYNSNMVTTPVSPVSPYRHDYSQTVIITTPVAPFHHDPYLTDHLPSPSARRQ